MKQRLKNLKRMHDTMTRMNNEEAYAVWITYVPDEPSEDDLKDIAEDVDDYDECVTLFVKLVYSYGSDGILEKK
ncbi:MAG: hypothetical protein J6X45_04960 [Lachnospiraceae bacterium]|nr:hypothetical protein [Lachnospiraceae bacterium]